MKCPNCEGALPGSAIVCKTCGHRLTQNSVEKWRSEHATSGTAPSPMPSPMTDAAESPLAVKLRARFAQKPTNQVGKPESNLIQFPVPANVTASATAKASAEPAWRDQIKARVQDRRTRQTPTRQTVDSAPEMALSDELPERPSRVTSDRAAHASEPKPKTGSPAQLLLVESALKRIRRTPAPAPATVAFRAQRAPLQYPAAQSHALALMPEAERYAEAQREYEPLEIVNEAPAPKSEPPVREPIVEPTPAPIAVGQALKNLRSTHKLTGAHLTLPLDETEPAPEFPFDALSLAADSLPEVHADRTLIEAKPVEILRAKASYFAEVQATEAVEEEPASNPWHTDAEAEAVAQESDGQVWLGKPAPIWLRTLAGVCDFEAAAILYLPFFSAYYALEGSFELNDYYLMAGMAVVVMFLYQLVTFTLNGRTIGMALFGLRNFDVERVSTHISFARRLQQALGGTMGLLCPPFNFVVTRVTGFQRGFGDALAKTVTLRRAQD